MKILVIAVAFMSMLAFANDNASQGVQASTGLMKIGGLLQTDFSHTSLGYSKFTVKKAELGVNGELIPERMNYLLSANFANQAGVLLDAKVMGKYIPFTTIMIGRYLPEWGMAVGIRPAYKQYFTTNPEIEEYMAPRRQIGAGLKISFSPIEFSMGVYNGTEVDVLGKTKETFDDVDGYKEGILSASVEIIPQIKAHAFSAFSKHNGNIGVGFETNYSDVFVVGEYITGKLFENKKSGYSLETGITLIDLLQPKLRYDYMNESTIETKHQRVTFGANLLLSEYNAMMKLDYELVRKPIKENKFTAELQISI